MTNVRGNTRRDAQRKTIGKPTGNIRGVQKNMHRERMEGRNRMWKGTGKGNCNNSLKTYLKAKDNASGNTGEKKTTTELNSLETNRGTH